MVHGCTAGPQLVVCQHVLPIEMCNLPHFNTYRLGSGLGGGAVLLI